MCSSETVTVEIEGKKISCNDITPANRTNNTLLLFLHDALGCSESWKDFPSALCEKTGSVGFMYDRLGHGKSAATTAKWSKGYLEAEADFLKKIITTQNLKNVVLIGSSDGGSIALLYAAKYQDCEAIVSIAGHSKVEEATTAGIRHTMQYSEKIISQLKKYHGDNTSLLFQNWHECWLSVAFPELEYRIGAAKNSMSKPNHSRKTRRICYQRTLHEHCTTNRQKSQGQSD